MNIPTATYRLQFNYSFGFKEAREIIVYLSQLGISSIYASPIFEARKGSLHGYDVVDPNQINPELGSVTGFGELIEELKKHEMDWIQDIVPNHMGYDSQNEILMDVLENGRDSKYFYFFDIEWNHPNIKGKLIAPFLGKTYGECLENKEIKLRYDENGFSINYYDLRLPIKIESYIEIISHGLDMLKESLRENHPDLTDLLIVLDAIKDFPLSEERYNHIGFIKRSLWEIYSRNDFVRRLIDEGVEIYNGKLGDPESYNPIRRLISKQHFRLCFWKVAKKKINYRRFFNINELISVRVEDNKIFKDTHSFIFNLVGEGRISGLRVDHVDGLYDPTNYLKMLRDKTGDTYIVVEKILDIKEELPLWPIQGTTGYEFLNYVNGIFCDIKNEVKFSRIYSEFSGINTNLHDLLYEKKKLIIETHMSGDLDNLARLIEGVLNKNRNVVGIIHHNLKSALKEIIAFFPVYRTYINSKDIKERDRSYIRAAVEKSRVKNPDLTFEIDLLEKFLLNEDNSLDGEESRIQSVMRFQQLTGPIMAKGLEDTTLYVYNRLLSLNDVGGDPDKFGISSCEFHDFNQRRARLWPHTMNTTSTHDTKRGEDVRARINVLSEIPDEWEGRIRIWSRINEEKKRIVNGKPAPDKNDEYFLYQTLIGAFPFSQEEYGDFVERIKNYMIKAVREAKVHTDWFSPNKDYEGAFISFIDGILMPSEQNKFLGEFIPFQKKVAHYGMFNSLSQTIIKITSPGVPDFFQGTEILDLNLVDPDNRRAVHFQKRWEFLQEMKKREKEDILDLIDELISTKEDGRIKLFLIYRALSARAERKEIFQNGDYIPLEVNGKYKDHVIAFVRKNGDSWAIVVAPRFLTYLISEGVCPIGEGVWKDTCITLIEDSPYLWKDTFTDRIIRFEKTLSVGEALRYFPVSLLLNDSD